MKNANDEDDGTWHFQVGYGNNREEMQWYQHNVVVQVKGKFNFQNLCKYLPRRFLEDKKVSKFLSHLLNKADCEWGPWIPGRKCSKRKSKRRDTRDMIQGAMYGGKPCEGKHYRIVRCKGKYMISKSVNYVI